MAQWPPAARVAAGVIALGAVLNAVAIMANGRMPYSPAAAIQLGYEPYLTSPRNEPADAGTAFAYLGDIVPLASVDKAEESDTAVHDGGDGSLLGEWVAARSGDRGERSERHRKGNLLC